MNINQVKKVMKKYKRAWEEQDADLILECFTKKCNLSRKPISETLLWASRNKKILDQSCCEKSERYKFRIGKCYLDNERKIGFAEWETYMVMKGKTHHLTGIMLLKMKGDKITYLNEYWNSRK